MSEGSHPGCCVGAVVVVGFVGSAVGEDCWAVAVDSTGRRYNGLWWTDSLLRADCY